MRACIQRGSILRRRCPRLQGVYNYRHISVSAIQQRPADSLSSASPFSSSPPPFPSAPAPSAQRGTSRSSSPPSSQILQNAHISTALHLTRALLPRVLSSDSPELVFWDGLLRTASEEIRGIDDEVHESSRENVHVVGESSEPARCVTRMGLFIGCDNELTLRGQTVQCTPPMNLRVQMHWLARFSSIHLPQTRQLRLFDEGGKDMYQAGSLIYGIYLS